MPLDTPLPFDLEAIKEVYAPCAKVNSRLKKFDEDPNKNESFVPTEEENPLQKKCPLCEKGNIEKKGEWLDYEYRGITNKLYQYYCYCPECGSDFAGKDELDENRKIILTWKEETDKKIEAYRNAKL